MTSNDPMSPPPTGPLSGVRVVEIGSEIAEYCGLLLGGLGAEVIKVEPPEGSPSRSLGPFLGDSPDRERSLHFWAYNRNKRSVMLDPDLPTDRSRLRALISEADVVLDSLPLGDWSARWEIPDLRSIRRSLIVARMTPFGDDGPWAGYHGSDLVHLALGGVVMNCGYDPTPDGRFDLPPMAPQAWQAYHMAGEHLAMGITAALLYRNESGRGQLLSCAVHEAVAKSTEVDLMSWVMRRAPVHRQTCRHAAESESIPVIVHTKDGRWMTIAMQDQAALAKTGDFLKAQTTDPILTREVDLLLADSPAPAVTGPRRIPGSGGESAGELARLARMTDLCQRFALKFTLADLPWRQAQAAGLLWAPLVKPHENLDLEHWHRRGTFGDVDHPELDRSLVYATSRWRSTETGWVGGRRAPLLGEHSSCPQFSDRPAAGPGTVRIANRAGTLSARGKPFALDGVRVLDFGWYLASAGGTRFLASLGAECLKVEFKAHPDTRMAAMAPVGGRAARRTATAPLPGSPIRTWAASSTTRIRANEACP